MDREIRIAVEGDMIRVTYRGKVEYEPTTSMLREVAALTAETGIERLLFDVRAANYRDYHLGTIRHSEEGPGIGIRQSFQIRAARAPAWPRRAPAKSSAV